MTYAYFVWKFAADSHLFKLQRLQNKVLQTTGNFPRRTPTRDLHMAFKISYLYDFVAKLCGQQAAVILNYENVNVDSIKVSNLVAVRHTRAQLSRQWIDISFGSV
jgi:hypothetical protein